MNISELTDIQAYHLDRLLEFGPGTAGALGWKSSENHDRRLDIFCGLGDISSRSVLDVGCGHGDLYRVLSDRFAGFDYVGIDQMQPFIDVAVKHYGEQNRAAFELGDFTADSLPQSDYVIASGALSYRCCEPDFIFKMLDKLFAACRIGFGFNLLSQVDHADGILVAYDQAAILAYCQSMTSRVKVQSSSVGDDFTVFLYR